MTQDKPNNLVLVTGAAGWLGLGLVNALANGIPDCELLASPEKHLKIRCLVMPGENVSRLKNISKDLEIMEGDITKPETMTEFWRDAEGATLYHCCGIIHPKKVKQFQEVNTKGAINVFNAAAKAGVKRAVVMSSNSPCGANPHKDHLFDENSPYSPYMGYGLSKMLMEKGVLELSKREGAPELVIIRAPWFYGPFQPDRQTEFFRMIRDGKGPLVGGGGNLRSMAYIDNLAQGMILAARTKDAAGEIFWIADERPYETREIISQIETLLRDEFDVKCKGTRLNLPGFASDAARIIDFMLQKAGLYNSRIHVLSEMNQNIACSVEKAKKKLNYKPTVNLEEGMRRSIAWMLSNENQKREFEK